MLDYKKIIIKQCKKYGFDIKQVKYKKGISYYILKDGKLITPYLFDSIFNAKHYITTHYPKVKEF